MNELKFQYSTGSQFIMCLYRVIGIGRLNKAPGDEIAFSVKVQEEPRDKGEEKTLQLPNIFMQDVVKAFQDDDFILASNNNGVADAVIVIPHPTRFPLTEYIQKANKNS